MSLQDNLIVAANFENSCCQLHRSVYQELKNLVEYLRAFIWCRVLVVILSCCSIYLSIYLSLQGKTRSRKTCWKGAGCHTLGDLSNVHAKHSSLRGACITLLLLFPLLQRYRHFHLQQDIFTPIVDCRCQVTAENRYKKTSLPAPRLAGEWYKYLIATVSLPWHRQNYFTPACCDHQWPATSGSIGQHLRLYSEKSGGATSISGQNPQQFHGWNRMEKSGMIGPSSTSPLHCSASQEASEPWR